MHAQHKRMFSTHTHQVKAHLEHLDRRHRQEQQRRVSRHKRAAKQRAYQRDLFVGVRVNMSVRSFRRSTTTKTHWCAGWNSTLHTCLAAHTNKTQQSCTLPPYPHAFSAHSHTHTHIHTTTTSSTTYPIPHLSVQLPRLVLPDRVWQPERPHRCACCDGG